MTISAQFRGAWRDGWHVVPHQVLFRDLDAFGHVNNATFFTYYEWGRAHLWWELTGTSRPADIGFIVAHAQCDFRLQVGLEPIDIATRIGAVGNTSVEFLCEIRKNKGRDVAASGRVVVVLYDWARQSKMQVGDELRRRVAEHAGGTSADASGAGAAAVRGDRRTP